MCHSVCDHPGAGATLALGGPGERARARQMLEKAALLKAEWVGGRRHPGMLHGSLSCATSELQHAFRPPLWQEYSLCTMCIVFTM
jgi:hypothetical protein